MRSILPLAIAVLGFFTPAAVLAGANKTWVSGNGANTGTCPFTAPCASFQYAYGQTNAGGEIDVKDSGGYGTLVINKAISVVAGGVLASVNVPANGIGILVEAGTKDRVVINGVTLDGHGLGGSGIIVRSTGFVLVTKSDLRNLYTGILLEANDLTVKSCSISGSNTAIDAVHGQLYISDNNITMNTDSVTGTPGSIFSYGDNVINSNSSDKISGGPSSVSKQ